MSKMKKLAAIVLAMIMVLAMAVPTFAASITIKDSKGTAANAFEAYQVFAGTLSEDKTVLSNIEWGSGVTLSGTAKITVGEAEYTAQEAADALAAGTLDVDDFATAVSKVLSTTYATVTAQDAKGDAVISNLEVGYYFVKNTAGSAVNGDDHNEAYTKFILQVIGDESVEAKTDAPEINKKLKNEGEADSAYRDANNVAIGDTVNYKITSHVPDMKNYEQYYFIVNDTLSKGLTYTDGSMVVKIGDDVKEAGTDYVLTKTTNDKGETQLEIVFKNFIQYKNQTGAAVVITYDAVLNDEAKINAEGNPNKVNLTYSNNPNEKGDGKDKPNDNEKDKVTGTTPDDWTITYTTKLAIYKTDAKTGEVLKDATFTMKGEKINRVYTANEKFVEAEDGTHYLLKDGTYTTVAPNSKTENQYASTTTLYKKIVEYGEKTVVESVDVTVTTGEDGIASLGSLAAGEYTITEIIAPDGYNMLENPIKIVITADSDAKEILNGTETVNWSVTQDGQAISIDSQIDATSYLVRIVNSKGATLPSTGGMGTTIFYVMGSILVAFAGVLLISKRRMAR